MSLDHDDALVELIPEMSMTKEDWAHVTRVQTALVKALREKYVRGKAQHKGSCWQKPGMLGHAIEEHTDQGVYLHTLREQMLKLIAQIHSGEVDAKGAADEIERWLTS